MTRVNDSIQIIDGIASCTECDGVLAGPGQPVLAGALVRRGDVTKAGPHIRPGGPGSHRDRVEFRQYVCPHCSAALLTEVAAVRDTTTREALLSLIG